MVIQATSTLTFIFNILIVLIYFWARVSANKIDFAVRNPYV